VLVSMCVSLSDNYTIKTYCSQRYMRRNPNTTSTTAASAHSTVAACLLQEHATVVRVHSIVAYPIGRSAAPGSGCPMPHAMLRSTPRWWKFCVMATSMGMPCRVTRTLSSFSMIYTRSKRPQQSQQLCDGKNISSYFKICSISNTCHMQKLSSFSMICRSKAKTRCQQLIPFGPQQRVAITCLISQPALCAPLE
jgi:hypothetical protein